MGDSIGSPERTSGTRRRGFAVAAAGAVGVSALSGCTAGSGEPARAQGVTCLAPEALQVQVAHKPGEGELMIISGGIGATELATGDAPSAGHPQAPGGEMPVQDLPPGVHARIADTSSGEVVRAETLEGGVAGTGPLPEGDYLVGLVSVEQPGRIDGVATAELRIDDRGGLVGRPAVERRRELPVTGLTIDDGALRAELSPAEEAAAEAEWWLDAPGAGASGTTGEDGTLSVEGVSDGPHTLNAAAASEHAPGIVEQAVRCEFGATDGELMPTPGAVRTGDPDPTDPAAGADPGRDSSAAAGQQG